MNNAVTHCAISWPNWTGIFDEHGNQRGNYGQVVTPEVKVSTQIEDFPMLSSSSLTEISLQMKDSNIALDDACKGLVQYPSTTAASSRASRPLSTASNASTRGSEVPRLKINTGPQGSPLVLPIDDSTGSSPASPIGASLSVVDSNLSTNDLVSPISTYSPVDKVNTAISNEGSMADVNASKDFLQDDSTTSNI